MSSYPEWWSQTVTVYNKFTDPQTRVVKWYRTVLNNCFWKYVGEKVAVGSTILETNSTICRIPENDSFMENYEWIKLSNDAMPNYFTLSSGDIIVRGDVDDEINEYQSGTRSTELITKYKKLQGCMVVDRVTIDSGIGLGTPHYYVKGI